MHNVDTIIWDWNGTLLNDIDASIESINKLLNDRKLPLLTKERYREVFGFPIKEYYQRIGFDFAKEPFDIPAKQYIEAYKKNYKKAALHKNTNALLEYYKTKGYKQILLSASEKNMLLEQISGHKISHFFNEIAGLNNIYAASKTELGIATLKKLDIPPLNACLIGDTTHDFEVARKIGCQCILVNNGHHAEKKLKETGAPVLEEIKDVKTLLI